MPAMIAIRAEDKNEWERRAPLTPDHVAQLTERLGIEVVVESSTLRAFPDAAYRRAGARVVERLERAPLVLGVKEIPAAKLTESTAYVIFAHVIKGQAYNMPLLARLLELRATLIDYERIADEHGRRLIFFGRHAGYAGMIDTLWALGRRLLAEGVRTELAEIRLAHEYPSLDQAAHHIARVGEWMRSAGFPPELDPIVFGFTGAGNVSLGAQEILTRLPFADVRPEDLPRLAEDPDRPRNTFFRVVFERRHRFVRRDGGPFDADEFARHPDRYDNGMPRYLDHLTALLHGAYWSPDQPRLVTRAWLREAWRDGGHRLRVIGDVTCDLEGSIEPTVRATTPGNPVYVHDVRTGRAVDGVEGHGPVIMAVDNLPSELPAESSQHFGDSLIRFVPALSRCDWTVPFEDLDLPSAVRRAVVAHRGALTPAYRYLEAALEAARPAPDRP